jgi:hypothetical protein
MVDLRVAISRSRSCLTVRKTRWRERLASQRLLETLLKCYWGLMRALSSAITVLRSRPYKGLGTVIGVPVDMVIGARR